MCWIFMATYTWNFNLINHFFNIHFNVSFCYYYYYIFICWFLWRKNNKAHLTQSLSTPSPNHGIKGFVWLYTGCRKGIVKLNCKDGSSNPELSIQQSADCIEMLFRQVKTYLFIPSKSSFIFQKTKHIQHNWINFKISSNSTISQCKSQSSNVGSVGSEGIPVSGTSWFGKEGALVPVSPE